MDKRFRYAAAIFSIGLLFFLSSQDGRADEYAQGKKIFENRCQMCHGANGKGDGPAAAAFNPKPQNFTDSKFWQRKDVASLITHTVEEGHGLMPAIELKPNEIKEVIDYISHTFRPGPQ